MNIYCFKELEYDEENYEWVPARHSQHEYFSGTEDQAIDRVRMLNSQQFERVLKQGDYYLQCSEKDMIELSEKLVKIRAIEDESLRSLMDEDSIVEKLAKITRQREYTKKQLDIIKNLDYTNKAYYLPHVPRDAYVYVFEEIEINSF